MTRSDSVLAFVHIEKCGGSTLIGLLRRCYGLRHVDIIPGDRKSMIAVPSDVKFARRLVPNLRSIAGHSIRPSLLGAGDIPLLAYTILRDPSKRYVSDFQHHVDYKNFPNDFGRWLEYEKRRNFQTKALALGSNDTGTALEHLRKFALVGFLDEYQSFVESLSVLSGGEVPTQFSIANSASARGTAVNAAEILDVYADDIRLANAYDWNLVEAARREFPVRRPGFQRMPAQGGQVKDVLNRAFRNIVYKPSRGVVPFQYHSLPDYRRFEW